MTYDSSVTSAPAGFKTAVQAAVQFFDTTFTSNVSVNIAFGWGEVAGQTLEASAVGESLANYGNTYTYAQVKTALAVADAGSAVILQAVQNLPTVDPTNGASFVMTTAEEKALGLYAGSSTAIDGYVGLSSADSYAFDPSNRAVAGAYDAIGVLEHEISEVLGRSVLTSEQATISRFQTATVDSPLDLFRYTAAGVHSFQEGSAYFSLDNGVTNLKSFNNGSNGGDGGDWAISSQADSFNAFDQTGVMSPVSLADIEEMQLLGYGGTPSSSGELTGTSANNYTAAFEGVYHQYTVGAGGVTVTGGPEGANDSLSGIQHIQFADGYLDYSATDPAGEVYRLYEATLGRAPDPEGLAYWVNALDTGTSLQAVANSFVGSAEFQAVYGANLSSTAFVSLLYQNVLERAPDATGLATWVNALSSGLDTRAQVVVAFSQSQEDVNASIAAVGQGLWVGNLDAAEVARLYDAAFARLPDLAGLTGWTQALENGTSLQQVANSFVGSAEFRADYSGLNNTNFVTHLYNNALHRAPDAGGLSYWVNALNTGQDTRAQVVLGFSDSAEHIANTAAHIDGGIWITG